MRFYIFALSFLFFLNSSLSSELKSESTIDVVTDVVKHDDWSSDKPLMFSQVPSDLMKKRFSKGFVKDWIRIVQAASKSSILDGDILTSYQGISGVIFKSAKEKSQTSDKAEVEVTISYSADEEEGSPIKTKTLNFSLIKEDGVWRVDDYESEDWAGEPATTTKSSTLKSVKSTFRKKHQK